MGLRSAGCYVKVWGVERKEKYTKVKATVSKKNKQTNQYEVDWSGFLTFIGEAHSSAASLKVGDNIKVTEFEVSTSYNKEKNVNYTNYAVYKFEMAGNNNANAKQQKKPAPDELAQGNADDLPF